MAKKQAAKKLAKAAPPIDLGITAKDRERIGEGLWRLLADT